MAIYKRYRKSGVRYQVKVKGSDGYWITETFDRLVDAEKHEVRLRLKKLGGITVTNVGNQVTVSGYFDTWNAETKDSGVSVGWRRTQIQMFRHYVEPIIGAVKLQAVTPAHASRVLAKAGETGRGPAVRMHIYNLMHKMFEDAVGLFEVLQRNPVLKTLRPKLPVKESRYLALEDVVKLLRWLEGKPFGVAIWLQVFAGLRAGEVQALKWENVDLERGMIHVRATYVRRENRIQDHPKGRKWHSIRMPAELLALLKRERLSATGSFVAVSPLQPFLSYHGYCKALTRYCREAEVPGITTHGLRHSTSELYNGERSKPG